MIWQKIIFTDEFGNDLFKVSYPRLFYSFKVWRAEREYYKKYYKAKEKIDILVKKFKEMITKGIIKSFRESLWH